MTGRAGSSFRAASQPDLVERVGGDHRVETGVDAGVKRLAVRGEEEPAPFAGLKRRIAPRALEGGERLSGRGQHFEGA